MMLSLSGVLVLAGISPASAQSPTNRVLSSVSVSEQGSCAIVRIDLWRQIELRSAAAAGLGDEVRIVVEPSEPAASAGRSQPRLETLRAPASELAAIHAIELEPAGRTANIAVHFKRKVTFKVAAGADKRSLHISVSANGKPCEPVAVAAREAPANDNGLRGSLLESQKAKAAAASEGRPADEQLGQFLAAARRAFEKASYERAVQLATKIVDAGESGYRQEALELLGEARERRGQLAHARAEYQEYLKSYPTGAGAERVRRRLAAIEAGAPMPAIPAAGAATTTGNEARLDGDGKQTAAPSNQLSQLVEPPRPPNQWTITQYGSLATQYDLNQGGRGFIEKPRIDLGWDKEDPYRTYRSAFLTNFDYDARFENAGYAGRIKLSASNQTNLISGAKDETRIAALYAEGRIKEAGVSARVGRQSASDGGVLGRFDGASVGYQTSDVVKLSVVGGSPVERASDAPFSSAHYFFGGGAGGTWLGKSLETGLYYIEEREEGLLDRRAIGADVRYSRDQLTAAAGAEYDVHFGAFNSANLTASRVAPDQSFASLNLDWRRSPVLQVTNALMGQGVFTLAELLQRYNTADIDQLALDRTAKSATATASYSRPLGEKLHWSVDFTVNHLSGMPASGGVYAVPSTGMAYYASTHLIRSSVFEDRDSVTAGLSLASTTTSDRVMLDVGASYPISADLRTGPVLRLGFANYKNDTRQEYQVMPTVRTTYSYRPDVQFDFEIGGKLGMSTTAVLSDYQTELLILAGVRYDFGGVR